MTERPTTSGAPLPVATADRTCGPAGPLAGGSPRDDASPSTRPLVLLACMWFAYFLNYCDRQAVFAMFPSLKADLQMTDQQLGLTGTVFLWVYAIGCPIAGQLGDRWSKRLLVVWSLLIWSLVTVATGASRSGWEMLTLRGAMGVSESLFMPTAIALTAAAFAPALRSRTIATLTTAQIAGTVAGSWFGGWMADQGAWRTAFYALGAVGLVYAMPYYLFLRRVADAPTTTAAAPVPGLAIAVLLRVRTYLVLCIIFPVFVFGLWLLYGWLPTFLHDKFQLSQSDAALNATIYLQGATLLGLLGGGWLADQLLRVTPASRFWLLIASLLLCAPSLHALGSSSTLLQTRLAATAFGLCSGLLMGNIFPAAFEVIPVQARASAVGVLNLCGGLVSGFATLFGGLWKQTLGIDGLLTATAAAYAAAGALLVVSVLCLFPHDVQPAE